ncbi:hypothetical protein HZH68_000950 [Vespula germanica]|uniref:Uncharacterized protein n=1 Tax=Vespula germanica TaxID=30212 RepID=A0A834NUK8_VESGE|nr:hypothetical protein HZH68_000950 [Vespula germanica]
MTEPEAYLATSQARSSTSCDSAYSMHSGYLATTLSPPLGRMGARIAAMAHHSNDGNHADSLEWLLFLTKQKPITQGDIDIEKGGNEENEGESEDERARA